ncbi:MAG: enoyl-CoA hydratase/isomerase family protein [Gemmatimonadales bacterium]
MTYQFIKLAVDGGVATLCLDRPPYNIMNIAMMEEINAGLLGLKDRPDVKVLLIRGSNDAFSAGVDIADHTPEKVSRLIHVFHRIFETMRLLDVVAVGAVEGIAFGGGFELALACNLIVASENARFQLPEVRAGAFPPLACVVLPRAGPRRKAMEWILTGDEIPVRDLERFGLLNRVFSASDFESELQGFVGKLTNKSGPVLQLAKRAQIESYYSAYEEALYKAEDLYLRELMALEDSKEGIRSFREKREPHWKDG